MASNLLPALASSVTPAMSMLSSALGRLRLVGYFEAVSFLVLLGVAMPLKYIWGLPLAVKFVGWVHGVLFITYVALIRGGLQEARWPLWRGLIVLGAALIPFGPFLIDRSLKARQAELQRRPQVDALK